MFGSSALEVAIGLVFIYLLISLVCTVVIEAIASCVNQRGKTLFAGIRNLLNDPKFTGLAQQIYTHGIVVGTMEGANDPKKVNRLPSYITARNFGLGLIDVLTSKGAAETWLAIIAERQALRDAAQKVASQNVDDAAAQSALKATQEALDEARAKEAAATAAKEAHTVADQAAAQVTGYHDLPRLQEASEKLQEALALGRTLAADLKDPLENVRRGVNLLPPGHTRETLYVLLDKTRREAALIAGGAGDRALERLQHNVEHWYNDAADRFSGWYKRWAQLITLVVAAVVVSLTNADTIALANRLSRDNALRGALVDAAQGVARQENVNAARSELLTTASRLSLPLGWTHQTGLPGNPSGLEVVPNRPGGWIMKVLGLLVTVLAVSMGAPFWFDTLSRFVNIRGAGTRPAAPDSSDKKSA
jgi:hypothetical protein